MTIDWGQLKASFGAGTTAWPFIAAGYTLVLVLLWFALKALAKRGHLVKVHDRIAPQITALQGYVITAPATFIYVALFSAVAGIQQGSPDKVVEALTRFNSTNILNLLIDPFRVLISSSLLIADNGAFWIGYVVVYVLIAARLEQRLGSARWLVVAISSHVIGTLLTVAVEAVAIKLELMPKSTAFTADVGVSFVMVGTCGAYLWIIGRPWKVPYFIVFGLGILGPLIVSHQIWDLGHFLATVVGIITGWWMIRVAPLRNRITWRALVAGTQRVEIVRS